MSYRAAVASDADAIQACKDAALRYCRGVDRLDPDEMRSAYWHDAVDEHGSFVGNAHEFVEHCMTSHLKWRATMHCVFNHLIEVDSEDSARGEVYNVTYLFRANDDVVDTWWGRYLDRYECRDGEWKIIHRVCVNEATMTTPVAQTMPMQVELFRSGATDRGTPGRPLGP